MSIWVLFWGILLGAALIIFAGLAVVVTVFGARDIRSLFRTLSEQPPGEESPAESPKSGE